VGNQLIPDLLPRGTIHSRYYRTYEIEYEVCSKCNPSTIEHDTIPTSLWRKYANILNYDCRFDAEDSRSINHLVNIDPLHNRQISSALLDVENLHKVV